MFEANNIVVNCPSCNTPLPVLLIQIATQQVITCDHCKKEFRLLDKDGNILDIVKKRVGLRTLHVQRKKDKWGESFQFVVNGVPFFAKGACWIPADTFAPHLKYEDYADLIKSATDANSGNMVGTGPTIVLGPYGATARFVMAGNDLDKNVKQTASKIAAEMAARLQPQERK